MGKPPEDISMTTQHTHRESDYCDRLRERLLSSSYVTPKTKTNDRYINNLQCPVCGDKTAYAYTDKPFAIICNRINSCGAKTLTRDLFPDVIARVEDEAPPTPEDPNRPAVVYLGRRGLSKSLAGLEFRHIPNTRPGYGGGVGFPLGKFNEKGEVVLPESPVFNIRIYNPPDSNKTHNSGSLENYLWFHPEIKYDDEKPLYITEGVIDALSLMEIGLQAVAVLGSTRAPTRFKFPGFKRLVLAFDNDPAGGEAFKRWKIAFPDADSITPEHGDWNDHLCAFDSPGEAQAEFSKKEDRFRALAGLLTSPTALEYGRRYDAIYGMPAGIFDFDGQLHFSSRTAEGALVTRRVSNFNVRVDHFQLDAHNPDQPEYRYRLVVTPKGHRPVKFTVSGSELSRPDGLTTTFLTHARALWEGEKKASLALTRYIVESRAPEVRQMAWIGYDPASNHYLFKDFAVNPDGQLLIPKKSGFFEIAHNQAIRPSCISGQLKPEPGLSVREIYDRLCDAWEMRAVVGIAFMVGAWFVVQIKDAIGFYPLLSFWGDNTSGKTYCVTAMNAMQCLDEEGLPMFKENTSKGELRKLGQVSGLFRAMLEGNAGQAIRFDYGKVLPLYNKNPLQVRAKKSNDNQTIEMPFNGALVFVQNIEPFRTPAQKTRFISVEFTQADIKDTVDAFNRVQALRKEQLANFYIEIMRHRGLIESEWIKRYRDFDKALEPEILQPRIRQNHALLLAFHSLIGEITGIKIDLIPYVTSLAKVKVEACLVREVTLADYFFNALDHLPEEKRMAALYLDEERNQMQILLPAALKALKEGDLWNGQVDKLQIDLRNHPAFVKSGHPSRHFSSNGGSEVKRAWLFDATKFEDKHLGDDEGDGDGGEAAEPESTTTDTSFDPEPF